MDDPQSTAPVARRSPRLWPLFLILPLIALAATWWVWQKRPRVSEEDVRSAIVTTIQRESPAAFLVSGQLDLTATVRSTSRTVLLPGLLDIGVSRTATTVRVPARVSYGIDVRRIRPQSIRLVGDSLVIVTIPPVQVHAVAPNLADLEVRTDRGWIRVPGAPSERRIEQRALRQVQAALRQQAEAHLKSSVQPRVNTARALERMLLPVLNATGLDDPRIEFRIGAGVVVEGER